MSLFNTLLTVPLFNALIFLYDFISFHDLGIAIILLTILVRVVLFPLFYKTFKHQTILQKLQPEIAKIQHTHKEDKEKQARAIMELYREHKVNPFMSFFLIFLQLPILIALYRVFLGNLTPQAASILYYFVPNPSVINHISLGLIDLSKKNIIIVILAAIVQYYQSRISLPKNTASDDPQANIAKKMVFIGPLMTVMVLGALPSAIGLYWLSSSVFSVVQQWYINKAVYKNETQGQISIP